MSNIWLTASYVLWRLNKLNWGVLSEHIFKRWRLTRCNSKPRCLSANKAHNLCLVIWRQFLATENCIAQVYPSRWEKCSVLAALLALVKPPHCYTRTRFCQSSVSVCQSRIQNMGTLSPEFKTKSPSACMVKLNLLVYLSFQILSFNNLLSCRPRHHFLSYLFVHSGFCGRSR